MVTVEHLKALAGRTTPYMQDLAEAMCFFLPQFDITTPQQVAHFLAQACHETDHFKTLREYASGADYEGRADLGNCLPGDGRRFRGRGIFQTTGRSNYRGAGIAANEPDKFILNPVLLENPYWAVWSAGIYWQGRKLGPISLQPDDAKVKIRIKGAMKEVSPVEAISRIINGGSNGLPERKALYEKAKGILGVGKE